MNRLTNNWSLKLISLVLAFLLWSHVRGEVNPIDTLTVEAPLRAAVPQGFRMAGDKTLPRKVAVILRGPRLSLRNVQSTSLGDTLTPLQPVPSAPGAVRASLEWDGPRAGEQTADVRAECTLDDIEVLGTRPAQVSVTLQPAS